VKYAYQELPHSEDTASPHSQEEDKERENMVSISKQTPQTINKTENPRVTTLERSVAKQFATGGLDQVLGCRNLTLAPTGSHINKTSISCLGEITPTHQSALQCCMQKYTNIQNIKG
jgi:hypothetical protein